MKKIIKSILLIVILSLVVILVSGCNTKNNKMVATKSYNDENFGVFDETIEVLFDKDKVNSVKMIMDFQDQELANSTYGLFSQMSELSSEAPEINASQDGKKVVLEMSSNSFMQYEDLKESDMTKENLKSFFEGEGYTIK